MTFSKKKERKYKKSDGGVISHKEYMKEYNQRSEVKSKKKELKKSPKYLVKAKEWRERPEVKARKKERESLPENKVKKQDYRERPENRQRQNEYNARDDVKARKKERESRSDVIAKAKKKRDRPENLAKKRSDRLKLKSEVFTIYSKRHSDSNIPCCRCCGENSNVKFLAVDHIDGRKHLPVKEQTLGGMKIYKWLMKNNYPEGFQILCHNCNCTKGIFGSCPHERKK